MVFRREAIKHLLNRFLHLSFIALLRVRDAVLRGLAPPHQLPFFRVHQVHGQYSHHPKVNGAQPVIDTVSQTLSYTQTSAQLSQAATTTGLQDTNQYFALYTNGYEGWASPPAQPIASISSSISEKGCPRYRRATSRPLCRALERFLLLPVRARVT